MTTDAELAAEFDDMARLATELSKNDPAYSLLPAETRRKCEAEAIRQRGNMTRAAHALRVKGMLVEALESVVTLMVDCPRDGTTAPAGDCDCDTCATFREVSAALAEARKTP